MSNKAKERSKTGDRQSMKERLCRALDLNPDAFGQDVLVELRGRNRVKVEGKLKILSYSPDEIRLRTSRGKLNIVGKRLFCSVYSQNCVLVDGLIISVGFEEEK